MIDVPKIKQLIADKDSKGLANYIKLHQLKLTNNKITANLDQIKITIEYWDKKQQVKKIGLNSLYGALLNPGCRFHDFRIGQSTTLTGRTIAKHMDSFVNQCITGKYDYDGEAIVYGDTDSSYFSAWPAIRADVEAGRMEWNKDTAIQVYDNIADQVNESFPEMMERECHCPRERGALIRGGRELIAETGLFIKKKRYAVLIYDSEGTRLDQYDAETAKKKGVVFGVGKVKAMGLDLKRSDTPKIVQDFLSNILLDVLTGVDRAPIIEKIIKFKKEFAMLPPWEKGTPKRVNNLSKYTAIYDKTKECGVGHVKAAIVWNIMRKMHGDNYSMKIVDGMKTIVCKLKTNPLGYTSIAYPTDEKHVPEWLKELPFDVETMEATVVDQKVDNLLSVLGWDITNNTCTNSSFGNLFSFD